MRIANIEVLHAIDRLQSGSPVFLNVLLDWFVTSHKEQHIILENSDDVEERGLARGRAQCLTYLIETIRTADEKLKKIAQTKR